MLQFVQTSSTCPEQYDVLLDGRKVGYLHLRHGYFYVACPDSNGNKVYEAHPKGSDAFEADERPHYLRNAVVAIGQWLKATGFVTTDLMPSDDGMNA